MAISWFAPRCFRYNSKMDCIRLASSSLTPSLEPLGSTS